MSLKFLSTLKTQRFVVILIAAVFPVIFLITALNKAEFFSLPLDDSYIHLQLAKTFSETGKLGLHPEVPGGGSSSLLWSMILSFLNLLHINLEIAAVIISSLSWMTIVFLIFEISRRFFNSFYALLITFLVALSGQGIAAALSGIEATLALMFALSAFLLYYSNKTVSSLLFAFLAVITRPEMVLIGLIYTTGSISNDNNITKKLIYWSVPVLAVVLSILMLRLFSGNWPITLSGRLWLLDIYDPFWVDPANYLDKIWMGILLLFIRFTRFIGPDYGFGVLWGIVAIFSFLYGYLKLWIEKKSARGLLLFLLAHTLFYVFVMPTSGQFGRYMLPLWTLMFIPISYGLKVILSKIPISRTIKISIIVLMIITYLPQFYRWKTWYCDSMTHLQKIHFHMADFINKTLPENTPVAAVDIGILSWKSGHVIIDIGGLSDKKMLMAMKDGSVEKLLKEYDIQWVALPEGRLDKKWAFAEKLKLNTENLIELEHVELGNEYVSHFMPTHVAFPAMGLYRIVYN